MPKFKNARYSIAEAAKALGMTQPNLINNLLSKGYLIKRSNQTLPSASMQKQLFMGTVDVPYVVGPVTHHHKKIFITGHSLGGGMAMISAPYLKGNGYNIAEVYTYASPRVIGNQSFVDKCNSLLGSNKIQRFEYGVDFVTKLWSPAVYSTQYKIPGNRHWLNQNGTDDDYNCAERTFPLTLNPLEYMDYSKSHIDKLNGDIGSITPISLISYLASTLDNPAAQRPREAHGYPLIDAGQHNPQYYVKKAFENMTASQKSILPAFVDSFPYVYPSVVGNR